MKKKVTLTIKLDVDYPDIEPKLIKKLTKEFEDHLKYWAKGIPNLGGPFRLIPILHEPFEDCDGDYEINAEGSLSVKIKSDKDILLDKTWEV